MGLTGASAVFAMVMLSMPTSIRGRARALHCPRVNLTVRNEPGAHQKADGADLALSGGERGGNARHAGGQIDQTAVPSNVRGADVRGRKTRDQVENERRWIALAACGIADVSRW